MRVLFHALTYWLGSELVSLSLHLIAILPFFLSQISFLFKLIYQCILQKILEIRKFTGRFIKASQLFRGNRKTVDFVLETS